MNTHQKPCLPLDSHKVSEYSLPWSPQPPQLCMQHTYVCGRCTHVCVRTANEWAGLGAYTTEVNLLAKIYISHFKSNNKYDSSFEDKALFIQATPLRRRVCTTAELMIWSLDVCCWRGERSPFSNVLSFLVDFFSFREAFIKKIFLITFYWSVVDL